MTGCKELLPLYLYDTMHVCYDGYMKCCFPSTCSMREMKFHELHKLITALHYSCQPDHLTDCTLGTLNTADNLILAECLKSHIAP